jgi:glucose/arabinose dehydrogenase
LLNPNPYARFNRRAAAWLVAAVVLASALPAPAQEPAVQSLPAPLVQPVQQPLAAPPPPPWQQGRPESMKTSPLVPHPPGLTAKPAGEIKLDTIRLPPGFSIELWAPGLPNARSIALGAKGTVFVGSRLVDTVYAVSEKDGKREVKTLIKGLYRPNGVAFHNGALYVAERSRILRYDNIEDNLDNPGKPAIVFDALPADEPHGWKYLTVGPDGWLYFNIGAPCNNCVPPDTHAQIVRVDPAKGVLESVAKGVRNSVGMAFHPVTKELWFTNNGRDWMGEDLPHDTLHRVTRKGVHFGYPYCHQGDTLDPELGRGRSCSEFAPPALKLGAHVAPLGMRFYNGKMFPAEYRNRIIIANHGSWNKTGKSGFNLTQVTLDAQGKAVKFESFAEGWAEGNNYWGRPVDVQVMPDGALLVSDDVAGALYRISYKR